MNFCKDFDNLRRRYSVEPISTVNNVTASKELISSSKAVDPHKQKRELVAARRLSFDAGKTNASGIIPNFRIDRRPTMIFLQDIGETQRRPSYLHEIASTNEQEIDVKCKL